MGCSPSKPGQPVPEAHRRPGANNAASAVAAANGLTALDLIDSSSAEPHPRTTKIAPSRFTDRYRGASFGSADSSAGVNSLSTAASPLGARRSSRGSNMPMLRSDGPPYLVASTRQARLAYIVLRSFVLQDWTTADRCKCRLLLLPAQVCIALPHNAPVYLRMFLQ